MIYMKFSPLVYVTAVKLYNHKLQNIKEFYPKMEKGTKSLPRGRRDRASLTVLLIQAQAESPW